MKHIIKASDIDELMLWLSKRPLLHIEKYNVLVHAGIFPTWTIKQAIKYNQLVQQTLTSKNISTLLKIWQNYKNNIWNNTLIGYEKQAMILNIFTKIRTLTKSRQINYNFKDNPSTNTKKLTPWFNNIKYSNKNFFFIFGHWSKLGIVYKKNFVSLDSGCVYGGSLTAIRLEDHQFFSQKILQ
jgi:bis(5'-nucleosyl)-tetraphosphatase (symmetrical)